MISEPDSGAERTGGIHDEISDEMGCEMSRDSTAGHGLGHARTKGRAINRFATITVPVHTALRSADSQLRGGYADQRSPRPKLS